MHVTIIKQFSLMLFADIPALFGRCLFLSGEQKPGAVLFSIHFPFLSKFSLICYLINYVLDINSLLPIV